MERWKTIAATEPKSDHRTTYAVLVTVFAELTGCADLWRSVLKEWDMRESTPRQRMENKVAEGEAKGRAEGERSALLLVLGKRFPWLPAGLPRPGGEAASRRRPDKRGL